MTLVGFVWSNLRRRLIRTLMTAAGVAIGVGLIVALLSIAAGVRDAAGALIHVGRADFGLFQEGVSDLTRSLLPESLAQRVARQPAVAETARIKLYLTTVNGRGSFLLFGLDPREFPARRLVITAGTRAHGEEALVGDGAAGPLRVGPGGTLRVGRREFRVAGLYHSGNRFEDTGAVLPLDVVERLAGRPGEVTSIAVSVKAGVTPRAATRQLERRFPGVVAVTEPGQAVRVDTTARLVVDAGWMFSLIALLVGGFGVTNTMAMSVYERTREIGVLRAVGWPARRVAVMIVSEALGIGLMALAVGLLLGYLAARLFTDRSGLSALMSPNFGPMVFAWGLAFALGVALLGALYPAWRATRLTPIEALRRE